VPVPGEQADAGRISARHQAIAVMLDFVNPVRAGRRSGLGMGGRVQRSRKTADGYATTWEKRNTMLHVCCGKKTVGDF
jgi:hypothetical protein